MTENEYIEREVLLEFLQNTYDIPLDQWMARNYWSKVVEIKQKFISCIEKIPAADVVEVVRCKDCRYNSEENGCVCHLRDEGGIKFFPFEDHYCGYGERKEATP